jgi:hypothetical protein
MHLWQLFKLDDIDSLGRHSLRKNLRVDIEMLLLELRSNARAMECVRATLVFELRSHARAM